MTKHNGRSNEYQLLQGAHDWAKQVEERVGFKIQIALTVNRRLGVWNVVTRALHVVDSRPAGIYMQRKSEWPNAEYSSLGAHILQEVTKLDKMLEEAEREEGSV